MTDHPRPGEQPAVGEASPAEPFEPTGHLAVDAALEHLAQALALDVSEHAGALQRAHERLSAELASDQERAQRMARAALRGASPQGQVRDAGGGGS